MPEIGPTKRPPVTRQWRTLVTLVFSRAGVAATSLAGTANTATVDQHVI